MELAIKLNATATYERCAFCGEYVRVDTGPALFVAEDWTPVCLVCAQQRAPALATLLAVPGSDLEETDDLPF